MTDHVWWCCQTCGEEMYDSAAVYAHRTETGHIGAALLSDKVPTAGPGSTPATRAAALKACADAVADARHRRTTANPPEKEHTP